MRHHEQGKTVSGLNEQTPTYNTSSLNNTKDSYDNGAPGRDNFGDDDNLKNGSVTSQNDDDLPF